MSMSQRGEPCYCGLCKRCLRRLRVQKFRENQRRALLGEPLLPANKGGPRKLAPDEHRLTPRMSKQDKEILEKWQRRFQSAEAS